MPEKNQATIPFAANAETSDAILALVDSGKKLNTQLVMVASTMAAEVASIDGLTVGAKVALLQQVYAAALQHLKPQKDVMARLNSLLLCRVAGDMPVEVAPPSKDGKQGATFKAADQLTATEAKKFASEVRQLVKEAEETPEEKAKRIKAEEVAKTAMKVIADKLAREEAVKKADMAFAFVLGEAQREELTERLEKIGLKLVKIPTAPAKK